MVNDAQEKIKMSDGTEQSVIRCRIVNKWGETESSQLCIGTAKAVKWFHDAFISEREIEYYPDGSWVYFCKD